MKPEWTLATLYDRHQFVTALMALPLDKPLAVTVKPYRRKRTLSQNATHWWRLNALCDALALDTGHTSEELHELLKARFCPVKPMTVMGYQVAVRSTKALDVAEMADFLTRVEAWAAEEWGFEMPEPIPAIVRMDLPEECEA